MLGAEPWMLPPVMSRTAVPVELGTDPSKHGVLLDAGVVVVALDKAPVAYVALSLMPDDAARAPTVELEGQPAGAGDR